MHNCSFKRNLYWGGAAEGTATPHVTSCDNCCYQGSDGSCRRTSYSYYYRGDYDTEQLKNKAVSKWSWELLNRFKKNPIPEQRWSKKTALRRKRRRQKKVIRRRK